MERGAVRSYECGKCICLYKRGFGGNEGFLGYCFFKIGLRDLDGSGLDVIIPLGYFLGFYLLFRLSIYMCVCVFKRTCFRFSRLSTFCSWSDRHLG